MTERPLAVVTGGAGFIGSHMVDLLVDHGFRVHVVDTLLGGRRENLAHHAGAGNVTLYERDIRSLMPDDDAFIGAQFVFHFAGIGDIVPSIERPADYMETNVTGTVRVLECARRAGVRKLVYAASSSCYGLATTPTREDHPIAPEYPYALSKFQGEQTVLHWHKVYGLQVNSIRIFNAYGPRVRTTGAYGAVFGVFLKQKLERRPFTIVGDGSQRRDFIYVTDVARAFLAAAETDIVGEIFNIGAGNPQSINRLVDLIGGERSYVPRRPGEPDCTWADINKAVTALGWSCRTDFETGVAAMIADIESWRNAPLWDPSTIADATATWFRYLGPRDGQ